MKDERETERRAVQRELLSAMRRREKLDQKIERLREKLRSLSRGEEK